MQGDLIKRFEDDGVVVMRNVIPLGLLAPVKSFVSERMETVGQTATGYDLQAVGRQVFEMRDKIQTGLASRFDLDQLPKMVSEDEHARPLIEGGGDPLIGKFFYEAGCWRESQAICELALNSALPRLMGELIDAKEMRFFEDTIFARSAHTPWKTAWHQDLDYFKVGEVGRKLIAWVPLDTCTKETGCTQYIRGSHKWGETYAANVFFADTPFSGSEHQRMPQIEGKEDEFDIVTFDVAPGDVIVHDVMTLHGASGNLSTQPRRAISFRYVDQDVRYFERPGTIDQTGISHNLETGDPLDCDDYPIVFSRENLSQTREESDIANLEKRRV